MRFLITFIFYLLVCSVLWFIIVWGQLGNPTKMSQWIYDVYEKKQKIAHTVISKKIVVVAGSNALFGVDSKILSKSMGLPVVNYGVNAGIELPLTLFLAQKVINKGDIVVMPLEYPMYSYDGTAGEQMIDFLLAREPDFFWRLSLREQLYLVWHLSIKRVIEGYFYVENRPITQGLFGIHHIDFYGDQNETEASNKEGFMFDAIERHTVNPEVYGKEYDQDALGWEYLESFVQWCKEREVKIVFMPSTLMWHESYKQDAKEQWFYVHFADEVRKRGWIYVGSPYDYMYDQTLYFDNNFHLIDSARLIRTQQMIDDLKKSGVLLKR